MLEVADIFRRYGEIYLQRYGEQMLPSHRRAFTDIIACRTAALGGHLYRCDQCDHEVYAWHSCKNRSCPKCHGQQSADWLTQRQKELLPVPYFHVVFTIPQELRALVRRHQQTLYPALMKSAAGALTRLTADKRYVGGRIGVMAILHTWSRTLEYHPHVHCLVPAGGLSPDEQWQAARSNFLVPVKALSKLFGGLFRQHLSQALPQEQVSHQVWKRNWTVYCKPSVQGPRQVLQYLGRYVHRIALTNSRIVSINNGRVCFRYRSNRDESWNTLTLDAVEFIRRFLQHVLPRGVHKVRYYGLWHPARRHTLRLLQLLLSEEPSSGDHGAHLIEPVEAKGSDTSGLTSQHCPRCGQGILACIGRVMRPSRKPP